MLKRMIAMFTVLLMMLSVTACADTVEQPALATGADADQIEALIVGYINEYRASKGVPAAQTMEDCNAYSEYRSCQMATNGCAGHDVGDAVQAAEAVKYGKLIDYQTGELCYPVRGFESVTAVEMEGTADEIAKALAANLYNQKYDWQCLGGDEYEFISVGVAEKDGKWYCCTIAELDNLDEYSLGVK